VIQNARKTNSNLYNEWIRASNSKGMSFGKRRYPRQNSIWRVGIISLSEMANRGWNEIGSLLIDKQLTGQGNKRNESQ
jgi:hypothetical protein